MNKSLYFKICSITIGSFLVIWTAAFSLFLMKERSESRNEIPEYTAEKVQNTIQSARLDHYIARAEGNGVAVYEVYTNGYEKLISMPEINLSQLTEYDRTSFEEGIVLNSKGELASLMEDFTS